MSSTAGSTALDQETVADTGTVLTALRAVDGVRSAELAADGLLKLDLRDDADEVEVATAVSRVLHERFGLGVDPGQVQMIEATGPVGPDPVSGPAVGVRSMHVTSTGRKVHVTVVVALGDREAVGEAAGTTSASGLHRAVAEATLHAIEELTDDAVVGRVEQIEIGEFAAVQLMLDVDGVELAASGSSEVLTDVRQAIVRAVVQATAPHLH